MSHVKSSTRVVLAGLAIVAGACTTGSYGAIGVGGLNQHTLVRLRFAQPTMVRMAFGPDTTRLDNVTEIDGETQRVSGDTVFVRLGSAYVGTVGLPNPSGVVAIVTPSSAATFEQYNSEFSPGRSVGAIVLVAGAAALALLLAFMAAMSNVKN